MADYSLYDPESVSIQNNNIFGLPFSEQDSELVILPVPWEVTVSYRAGTARAPEHLFSASMQVDIYDKDFPDAWKSGYFMRHIDKKILLKSDYLRKEAELYISFISAGDKIDNNKFMCKTLREVNEGSEFLNNWVYEQCAELLTQGKQVGLVGGDHSISYGFIKALAERHEDFGILQIDAHADLRCSYEGFVFSHASIMHNVLKNIPQVSRLVQIGVRDYSEGEFTCIQTSQERVRTFFDKDIRERQYEGETWKQIADDIIGNLPDKVYISFDIDGLDPKLCPNTGTPVHGGFEAEQVSYLFKKLVQSGKQIIGFDLNEIGISTNEYDENVGARMLLKLCNVMATAHALQQAK